MIGASTVGSSVAENVGSLDGADVGTDDGLADWNVGEFEGSSDEYVVGESDG